MGIQNKSWKKVVINTNYDYVTSYINKDCNYHKKQNQTDKQKTVGSSPASSELPEGRGPVSLSFVSPGFGPRSQRWKDGQTPL